MSDKTITVMISVIIGAIGGILIVVNSSWLVLAGVALFVWGNNINESTK